MLHIRYIFRTLAFDRWLQRELRRIDDNDQKQLFMSALNRVLRTKRRLIKRETMP
jgi:hypothetical protein